MKPCIRRNHHRKRIAADFAVLIGLAGAVLASRAVAQEIAASPAGTGSVAEALSRLCRSTGVLIVADSTVANERVPLPPAAALPETAEQQVAGLVKMLPLGTTWAKLYMPAPPAGRVWTGDAVATYARAQAGLFGTVGAKAPEGTVEILGKHVAAEKARDVIAALDLKPVYLVTNPRVASAAAAARWRRERAASQLLQMNPAQRRAALQQMPRDQRREILDAMTPEQRQQFRQNMGGGGWRRRGP